MVERKRSIRFLQISADTPLQLNATPQAFDRLLGLATRTDRERVVQKAAEIVVSEGRVNIRKADIGNAAVVLGLLPGDPTVPYPIPGRRIRAGTTLSVLSPAREGRRGYFRVQIGGERHSEEGGRRKVVMRMWVAKGRLDDV